MTLITKLMLFTVCSFAFDMSCKAEVTDVKEIKGQCNADSHVAEGNIGEDLTNRRSRFYCDSVVIGYFDNIGKHIMVNFSESQSHTSAIIGYAGYMEHNGKIMIVDNVYLGGKQFPVKAGECLFFYKNKKIKDISCAAPIDEGERRTVPVVSFSASEKKQSSSMTGLNPSSIAMITNAEGEDIYLTKETCKSPSGVPLDKLKIMHKYIHNKNIDDGCYSIDKDKVNAIWNGSITNVSYELNQFNFNK